MPREGEKNGRSKLNQRLVNRLRKIYKKGKPFQTNPVSVLNMAVRFDVAPSTMWNALNEVTWI